MKSTNVVVEMMNRLFFLNIELSRDQSVFIGGEGKGRIEERSGGGGVNRRQQSLIRWYRVNFTILALVVQRMEKFNHWMSLSGV